MHFESYNFLKNTDENEGGGSGGMDRGGFNLHFSSSIHFESYNFLKNTN